MLGFYSSCFLVEKGTCSYETSHQSICLEQVVLQTEFKVEAVTIFHQKVKLRGFT